MEEVLLKKILDKVEQIGTDFNEFKTEMYEFRDEMHEFKDEMYEFRDEMHEFKDEMYEFRDEMHEFKDEMHKFKDEMYEFMDEMHKFKDEMYEFKNQVHKMFDQYSKEIAMEINELAELISKKFNEFKLDSQREFNINKNDHIIYETQIEKLQTSNKYIESKIHI